jgi:hypothetical protein
LEETGNIKPQNLIQTVPSITPDYASVKRCSPSFSIVVVTRSPGLSQTCFSVRKVLRACSMIDLLFIFSYFKRRTPRMWTIGGWITGASISRRSGHLFLEGCGKFAMQVFWPFYWLDFVTGNPDIIKTRTDFFPSRNAPWSAQATAFRCRYPRLKGGSMNRIEKKEIAPDASKVFQSEVRSFAPDITRKELCDMVDDYIYYQTDDISREEAYSIVDITCRMH